MTTYQFSTEITRSGDLPAPPRYLESIPSGSKVKVTLVIDSPSSAEELTEPNGTPLVDDQELSLEEYITHLRNRPLPKSLSTPASTSFREYFAASNDSDVTGFDEAAWNQQWDQIEAEMNADEQIDGQKRQPEN